MPLFLLPLLKWLGGFLTGPLLQGALDAYKAKLGNENNADARTADLAARELAVEQREAELNTQLQIADEGHWYTACIRPLFAAPFLIYNFKLLVWDKVLASLTHGVTDPLSPDLMKLETTVIGFYFIGRSGEKIAAFLKRRSSK